MGLIKSALLLVLVIVGIGAGLVVASHYLPVEEWNGKKIIPAQLASLVSSSLSQIKLPNVGSSVQQISGKVLGVHDDTAGNKNVSSEQSLPQKTFDFARYTYCKTVVETYERTAASPLATSSATKK